MELERTGVSVRVSPSSWAECEGGDTRLVPEGTYCEAIELVGDRGLGGGEGWRGAGTMRERAFRGEVRPAESGWAERLSCDCGCR